MSTPYGMQALTGELNKLARAVEGDRNNTLNEVWLKLCHVIGAGHLDKLETAQQVYDAARQLGLADSEIRATMASAENGARQNPRERQQPRPPIDFTGLAQTPSSRTDDATSTAGEPQTPDYDHLYLARSGLAALPHPEPLIDGVLDEHTLFAVTGRDRSYKSFLVLDWLACLATGKRWLEHTARQTKILYVVGEGAYGLDARITAWETAWKHTVPDELFHVRRSPVNLFKRAADVADLYERIEREQYGVVVFDTLQRMTSGAETNYDRDAGAIVETMDLLRRANNRLAVGVVAHTQKSDADIRGSSAFEDDIDIIWRVQREDDDQVISVKLDKRKDGPEDGNYRLRPKIVPGTESIILELAHGHAPVPLDGKPLDTLKVLARDRIGGGNGMSPTEIEHRTKAPRTSVYRVLDSLEDQGLVSWTQSGRSRLYKITDQGVSALEQIEEMPQ